MAQPGSKPNSSVAALELRGSQLLFAPYRSLRQALISVGLVILGLVVVDRFVLPVLDAYRPDSAWHHENAVLIENMKARNEAHLHGDWVWRSRGRPVQPKSTKKRRLLVMGDSFVWGDGYANLNDLWWMQLQRELLRRGYLDVEVIAAGLMGAATHDQLDQARTLVPRYRPDLILWGHVANDPDEGLVPRLRVDSAELLAEDRIGRTLQGLVEARRLPRLAGHLLERRSDVLGARLIGEENGYFQEEWRRRLLQGENLQRYEQTLAALARFHDEAGIEGIGVTLPVVPDREQFAEIFAPIPELYAKAGIPMLNLADAYLERYPDGKPPGGDLLDWGINPVNGHPAAIVTSFHAARTADYLERHHADLLGPRSRTSPTEAFLINDWLPHDLEPESRAPNSVSFTYPDDNPFMRSLPVGWPYLQLNLETPLAISELVVDGPGLAVARLHVTVIDPVLGYDDGTVHDLGEVRGSRGVWSFEGQRFEGHVNTLGFAAGFSGGDRSVTLSIEPRTTGP